MSRCAVLSSERIVAYLGGELGSDAEDDFEAHMFGCADCSAAVERLGAITTSIAETIPPAVTLDRLRDLRASGVRIRETQVEPDTIVEAHFSPDLDLLIHALHAEATAVERIDLEVLGSTDELFMRVEAVPFDADAGVVYVACQRHLRGVEDVEDTRFRLTAVHGRSTRVLGMYVVRHHWV